MVAGHGKAYFCAVMTTASIKESALAVIRKEAAAVSALETFIDDGFVQSVELIAGGPGRLIVSGVGKSAIVAQKIVATLNSTGTLAGFMHAGDAIHGDLGMIGREDIIMLISKSGESPEIKVLLPLIAQAQNTLIAMTGNLRSLLARQAKFVLNTTVDAEACLINLAPTSSTTAQMVMGDALAVTLMELRGFTPDDFARFHPGGTLGKKLYLRVSDLYIHNARPTVSPDSPLREVIMEMTSRRLGATAVVNAGGKLEGIITDGDLRRMLEKNENTKGIAASDIMTKKPATVEAGALAVEALGILRARDISQLLVMDGDKYIGFIHLHDLIREGII